MTLNEYTKQVGRMLYADSRITSFMFASEIVSEYSNLLSKYWERGEPVINAARLLLLKKSDKMTNTLTYFSTASGTQTRLDIDFEEVAGISMVDGLKPCYRIELRGCYRPQPNKYIFCETFYLMDTDDDFITYNGKPYKFNDIPMLAMQVENEKNKKIIDELQ